MTHEPLMLNQADIDETAVDVRDALDAAWRKVLEAQDLCRYAESLIVNTSLVSLLGRVVAELHRMQFDYVRLVQKWDDVPECRNVRLLIEAERQQDDSPPVVTTGITARGETTTTVAEVSPSPATHALTLAEKLKQDTEAARPIDKETVNA